MSRNEKKATFSFYLSLTMYMYNGQVTWRKGLIKKRKRWQLPVLGNERGSDELDKCIEGV